MYFYEQIFQICFEIDHCGPVSVFQQQYAYAWSLFVACPPGKNLHMTPLGLEKAEIGQKYDGSHKRIVFKSSRKRFKTFGLIATKEFAQSYHLNTNMKLIVIELTLSELISVCSVSCFHFKFVRVPSLKLCFSLRKILTRFSAIQKAFLDDFLNRHNLAHCTTLCTPYPLPPILPVRCYDFVHISETIKTQL